MSCRLLMSLAGAIFLEVIPKTHQWLLTLLSAWWALGQLFASLVAWPLIDNFSCASDANPCLRADNMGWRYSLYVHRIVSDLYKALMCNVVQLYLVCSAHVLNVFGGSSNVQWWRYIRDVHREVLPVPSPGVPKVPCRQGPRRGSYQSLCTSESSC